MLISCFKDAAATIIHFSKEKSKKSPKELGRNQYRFQQPAGLILSSTFLQKVKTHKAVPVTFLLFEEKVTKKQSRRSRCPSALLQPRRMVDRRSGIVGVKPAQDAPFSFTPNPPKVELGYRGLGISLLIPMFRSSIGVLGRGRCCFSSCHRTTKEHLSTLQ